MVALGFVLPVPIFSEAVVQKRRLLNFVLSNCAWEDSAGVATFRQPFDMLAETATAAARVEAEERAESSKTEIWPGD